jgi:hypothetical protein
MKCATWLLAAWAVAGFGCSGDPETQVITGRVGARDALAVRAIAGESVVTAGRVRSDGSFRLILPAGARYRLEVLTSSGVRNVVGTGDAVLADLAFEVCDPTDPFDMGNLGPPGELPPPCDPMSDPNCDPCGGTAKPDGTCGEPPPCDPADPNCIPLPPPCDPAEPNCVPPPCDPMTDPLCVPPPCDPSDPNCVPPPPCDPADPSCVPPPCLPGDPTCMSCDPVSGIGCEPPKCDPTSDPNCELPTPCIVAPDGTCEMCDPTVEANCPIPPPPCEDLLDPATCKDPCIEDPALCGCSNSGTVDEMTCWPLPEPCDPQSQTCASGDALVPEHLPGDFGCKEPNG